VKGTVKEIVTSGSRLRDGRLVRTASDVHGAGTSTSRPAVTVSNERGKPSTGWCRPAEQ
jgi:hypothetical protein